MIHVLGAGNIGSLFALSLARKYPVQFLLRPSTFKAYADVCKSTVQMNVPKVGGAVFESQIPAESISPKLTSSELAIEKLVVAVKAHDVVSALASVRRNITESSQILVLHNGMGVWEHIQESWDGALPQFAFGVTDAGVKRHPPMWKFDYTGRGLCTVSRPPTSDTSPMPLLDNLVNTPELVVTENVPWDVFTMQQKRKLVVNAAINPLTALMQCENGALPILDERQGLIYKIVQESCRILDLDKRELMDVVASVIERTATNHSSMLSDVENGRVSEIENINGYIAREAKRQGKTAPLNSMLRDLVRMRVRQTRRELDSAVPLVA